MLLEYQLGPWPVDELHVHLHLFYCCLLTLYIYSVYSISTSVCATPCSIMPTWVHREHVHRCSLQPEPSLQLFADHDDLKGRHTRLRKHKIGR